MTHSSVPTACAQDSAILDSLTVEDPVAPWNRAVRDNSRKVLPDVAATQVPRLKTPKQPPRLDNPLAGQHYFLLAQQAGMAGNFDLAGEKLGAAGKADPGLPQYALWRSSQAMKRWDPASLISATPELWRSLRDHPLARKRLLLSAHQVAVLWTGVLWTLLVIAGYFRYWRALCHDFAARILSHAGHWPHGWLGLLPLLVVLLLRPGWFGALALLTVPLLTAARGIGRLPLTATMMAATLLLVPWWSPLKNAVPAIDPDSETTLLTESLSLPSNAEQVEALRGALATNPDPERKIRLQLALATQLSRLGNYSEANELFGHVLNRDGDHIAALVGRANNTYYLGQLDSAIESYERAMQLAPELGAIPYNLAQAYFKKLFLPEAGQMLTRARANGFDPPVWEDASGRSGGYSPVAYLSLNNAEIEASCRADADACAPLAHLGAWHAWLCPAPTPLFILLALALTLCALLALWRDRSTAPTECANCGWTICDRCGFIHDDSWLCSTCDRTVERARSEVVRATLLKNRSRAQRLPWLVRLQRFGRLVPGGAHLAIDCVIGGMLRLLILATGLTLLLFGWAFDLSGTWASPGLVLPEETIHPLWLPLPTSAWHGFGGWPMLWGGIVIVIVYLATLADGATLRRKLPKRLTTQLEADPAPPRAAHRNS